MPELPEVEALTRFLDERLSGAEISRVELAALSALRTVDPPPTALVGRSVAAVSRRGKHLCLAAGDPTIWLVVHLARGGWLRWYDELPAKRLGLGRGPLALRFGVAGGPGFDLSEMGTEKRLALWVVGDPDDVESVATAGPDALDPALDAATLGERLAASGGTVKQALSRQSVVAGIGNGYSDEILHAAHLSPYARVDRLDTDDLGRLHSALRDVLESAVARSCGLSPAALKGDKHRTMAVHGRAGESCPTCQDTILEVVFATRALQYCPTCQTNGRILADRRLSRLLR